MSYPGVTSNILSFPRLSTRDCLKTLLDRVDGGMTPKVGSYQLLEDLRGRDVTEQDEYLYALVLVLLRTNRGEYVFELTRELSHSLHYGEIMKNIYAERHAKQQTACNAL